MDSQYFSNKSIRYPYIITSFARIINWFQSLIQNRSMFIFNELSLVLNTHDTSTIHTILQIVVASHTYLVFVPINFNIQALVPLLSLYHRPERQFPLAVTTNP